MAHSRGFSLVELIITLGILCTLLTAAWPTMSAVIERNRATAMINWLVAVMHFSRHSAVVRRAMVTVCAPRDEQRCGGNWETGVVVFTDGNGNARIDGDDEVLMRSLPPHDHGSLTWRAFQNRRYLQYTQLGFTDYQNGNFVYCPDSGNPQFARQLVINIQGRTRVVHYTDRDGNPIDRRGKPLRCQ